MKFFLLLLAFSLGFLISDLKFLFASLVILCLIFVIAFKKVKLNLKRFLILLAFTAIGLSFSLTQNYLSSKTDHITEQTFVVQKAKTNYFIVSNYVSHFYIYEKNNPYDDGDWLKISGNVSKIENNLIESQFNFSEYLENYGVKCQIYPSKIQILLDNPFSKKAAYNRNINDYDEDAQFILSSTIYGIKDYDSSFMDDFRNINFINAISNSGFLFSFSFLAIFQILNLFLRDKRAKIVTIVLFLPFALMNLFTFGIIRYYLFYIMNFFLESKKEKRPISYFEKVSLISLVFLFIDPFLLNRLEFLLSFGLSFTMVSLNYDYSEKYESKRQKIKRFFLLRIYLFLFMIPINLATNNSLNIYSIIIQILLTPMFKIIYFYGFISMFCGFNPLINYMSFLANKTVSFFSNTTLNIYAPSLDLNVLILYYLIFFAFILMVEYRLNKVKKITLIASICAIVLYFIPIKNIFTTQVYFINVGQGDSILIRDRNNTCLIDTGGLTYLDVAKDSLIPFFKKNRIYNIDTVFITHNDFDHSGALSGLIDNFKVKTIINKKGYFEYQIGDLNIKNLNTNISKNENESSLVLYSKIKSKSFLFMGDAPKSVEDDIIANYPDLNVDILKVGHHGSNTSSSDTFIKHYKPSEAVISCGVNNRYGHPNDEVITTLKKYNVNIRRTDKEGTIIYNL